MIPTDFIQTLLNQVDIVEVVGRYISIKKTGANWIGLCPFHDEKSPSFSVSPIKQFYYCFGCSANGSAIGFLMDYLGISFVDAVKDLAKHTGMSLPDVAIDFTVTSKERLAHQENQSASRQEALRLSDILQQANTFFHQQLQGQSSTHLAQQYLTQRGVTTEMAARFYLGYAPEGWRYLRTVFPDYDHSSGLVDAGLVIAHDDKKGGLQKRYDRFRHRIIFPIRNIRGQVIAFGARVLDNSSPKYLNSPETPLFQKSIELYGLYEARQAIRKARYVLVTEGYMDVVMLAQYGFLQTVATLGTACTLAHIHALFRHTDRIIFSFDGDAAGQAAACRALETCLPAVNDEKTIQFLFLPDAHDPDSFVRAYGAMAFQTQIQNACPLSRFLLDTIMDHCDMSIPEGRARAQHKAKSLLQRMSPSALRFQLVHEIAQRINLPMGKLEVFFALPGNRLEIATKKTLPRLPRTAPAGLEHHLLRLLIAHPKLVTEINNTCMTLLTAFASITEANESIGLLKDLIAICRTLGDKASFVTLSEHCRALACTAFSSLIADIATQPPLEMTIARTELLDAMRQIQMRVIKHELSCLAKEGLKSLEEQAKFRGLMQKQQQLQR